MTMKTSRLVAVAAGLGLLVLAAPSASARPAQVGLVSFTAASSDSLTLDWPTVSGATKYQVFQSTSTTMSNPTIVKNTAYSSVKVSGLTRGKTYCFQVRALAGSSIGTRSAHTCKPTIRAQAAATGPTYSVMSFNACSDVCSGWSTRRSYANKMIAARNPDVIATQEAGSMTAPPGYTLAADKSAKRLFYKTSRFTVAYAGSGKRAGYITIGNGKYSVWAELIDRSTGKHVIFSSTHTTAAYASYATRGAEVSNLLRAMRSINSGNRPVVFAGDFNSTKNRGEYQSYGFGSQDTVGKTFADNGFYDGYDLAQTLKRPNWNSYSGFHTTPTRSYEWGDHVDHVFVMPGQARVLRWMNASLYSGTRYVGPMPSDHSPIQVDVQIN